MLKVVTFAAVAVSVLALPESRFIGHYAQARDYPAPAYGPPPVSYGPPQPPPTGQKGQGKGKGGLFDFDIFKGIKDFFSFGGKGKGGQSYGPPPAPSHGYGPPPKAPKGNYGPPPKAPKGNYGPPPTPPKASYGPPPTPPKASYGPPPKASFRPPPKAPKGNYGPPPPPPKASYGPPPQPPKGNYGPPPAIKGSHGHTPVAPAPSYGPPPVVPPHSYGPPPPAPAPSYGPPPPAPAPSYGPPPVAPSVGIGHGYGAPKPGDIITAPSGGYAPPPPHSNHFVPPPPAPSNNYAAPPPLPLETAPQPSGGYAPPPIPLPLETVPAPADNYGVPPPPPPPPVNPNGYIAPTQNVVVPTLPVAPVVANPPVDIKPDCEACDQVPWEPMQAAAPVPPAPAPVPAPVPADPTGSPAPIDIYPPSPAIDVRLVPTADEVETEGPIFIIEDEEGARDPRVMDEPVTLQDASLLIADDAPFTTITSDDVIETEAAFVVDEGEPEVVTLDAQLPEVVDVRAQVDNVILDTEAPVLETEAPSLETIAPVLLLAEEPEVIVPVETEASVVLETEGPEPVLDTEAPAPILETEAPVIVLDTEDPVSILETEAPAPVIETESPAPVLETEAPAAPLDLSVVNIRTNDIAEPLITPAVLQDAFALTPNDVMFRLTDPEVVEVGQPQFISSSEGTAGPSQFVSISNPEVVSVGEPVSVSVSDPNILNFQQPQVPTNTGTVQIQEDFTPVILPNINQNVEPANVVSVGQPQFIDQSFGQPQPGIPLSVSQPQLNSVSQPQVISVSQPQIVSVSQPQFPTFQQQPSPVTVTQPDGNYYAPQISIAQSSPTSSSHGGLQVAQLQTFNSQISDGGISVLDAGTPQFVGSSQGTPGISQVVSVGSPQLVSISDPQIISLSPQDSSISHSLDSQGLTISSNLGIPLSSTSSQSFHSSNNNFLAQHQSTPGGTVIAAELISSLPPNLGSFSQVEQNNVITQGSIAAQPPSQIISAELVSSSLPNADSFGQTIDVSQIDQSVVPHSGDSSIIQAELLSYSPPNLDLISGNRESHSLDQTGSLVSNQSPSSSIIQADIVHSSQNLETFSRGNEQTIFPPQQIFVDTQSGSVSNFGSTQQGSVTPVELSFSNTNILSDGNNQISFVGQSFGGPVDNQVTSISQPQLQSISQPEVLHSFSNQESSSSGIGSFVSGHDSFTNQDILTINQGSVGVPLSVASSQLDNNFSLQQDFSGLSNQFISGPTFIGESFGNVDSSQVLSLSEPVVNSVSQPELLHSTFSSADSQDSLGISITSTSPQVKTPDMSSLPLADSSAFSLSSSSPEFPPFSSAQDIANDPFNTVDVPAQPAVVVQDSFAPSFQQTIRENPPQLSYLPPSNSALLGNVDVRASSQQVSENNNIAKSVLQSHSANAVNIQTSEFSQTDVNGINLKPIPVRKTPTFEISSEKPFEQFSRGSSGFEYTAPGQRVQLSFGFPHRQTQSDGKSFEGSDISISENTRPARNIGLSNVNSNSGNSLLRRSRNRSFSKLITQTNPLLTKVKSSLITTKESSSTPPIADTTSTTTSPTTTTTTPTTSTTTTTTATITTSEKSTSKIWSFPTKTKSTTDTPLTTTETSEYTTTSETGTTTVKISTIKPRFRGRKRLRRPLSRRPITASTQSPVDKESPQSKQWNAGRFSVRRRITSRQRPSTSVILAGELQKEEEPQKELIDNDKVLISNENEQDIENNHSEVSHDIKVLEHEKTSTEAPQAGISSESQNAVSGNVDTGGSAKSIESGQSLSASPQRNGFVFPKRRDPILPFGTRLSRPRPSSPFTNPTLGPSPLTSSKTLSVMKVSSTLTNSLDQTHPFQSIQSGESVTASKPECPNNMLTDKPKLNPSPKLAQLNMLPVLAPPNLPFIIAPVISHMINDTPDPPPAPSEILAPPPSQPIKKPTNPPRLQRLFPNQQIPGTFTLHQNGDSFTSSTFSSMSLTSTAQKESRNVENSQLSLSQNNNSSSISREQDNTSFLSQSVFKQQNIRTNPSPTFSKINSRGKLFPTSAKPKNHMDSISQGNGKALRFHQIPVLQRPLTPKTRPLTRVAQTPVSEDYIKNFPEVAVPEGFPGEDPEEDTIKVNIFELQRIN